MQIFYPKSLIKSSLWFLENVLFLIALFSIPSSIENAADTPTLFKSSWINDFDGSFELAKKRIAEASADPLSNQLCPSVINFETRIIAHIVSTTILPRTCPFSTFSSH